MLFRNRIGASLKVANDRNSQPVGVFVCVFEHFHQFVHHRPIFPTSKVGNNHVGHLGAIQQLPNGGDDPLFGNEIDFGAVKSQRRNGRQRVDVIDFFVGDESRFDKFDTGLLFQIQVASQQ